MKRTWKQIGSLVLVLCMVLTMLPVAAFAETGEQTFDTPPPSAGGTITAFAALAEDIAAQTAEPGTPENELALPESLAATATDSDGGEAETAVPVSGWTSAPNYDGDTAGNYVFAPTLDLPDDMTLAEGVTPPTVIVTVVAEALEEAAAPLARGVAVPMDAESPTDDGTRIYANGTPVVIKAVGETTNMYLATDTNFGTPIYEDISGYVIYGGWENGDHTGDTSVTVLSGTFNKTVYGGSREGSITGNTNLLLQGGTFNSHAYGGSTLADADVSGCANVTAENVTFLNSTLWGAGLEANTVGSTHVIIKSGSFLWAYGGGNQGSVAGTATLTITGGTFTKTVFGGSDNASATVQNTDVTIANANIAFLYGGGWAATVTDTAKLTIKSGSFGNPSEYEGGVWGGGGEVTAAVKDTLVTIQGGTFPHDCSIYGGGWGGPVTDAVKLTIEGGTFDGDAFGGGCRDGATVGSIDFTIKSGTFSGSVFGGGCLTGATVGSTNLNIQNGIFNGWIFGGGFDAAVTGMAMMVFEDGAFNAPIRGAGNQNNIGGDMELHLKGGTYRIDPSKNLAIMEAGIPSASVTGKATIYVYPEADIGGNISVRIGEGAGAGSAVKYAVTALNDGGGTADASLAFAQKDEQVTLTASPSGGRMFKEWQVVRGGVTVTDNKFIMPAGVVTVKAIFKETSAATVSDDSRSSRHSGNAVPATSANVGAGGVVSQGAITAEAAQALAGAGGTAILHTQNAQSIAPDTLRALAQAGAQAGKRVVLYADTMSGSGVQGRLYVQPALLTGLAADLQLGVYTDPAQTAATTSLFGQYFSNSIVTVSFGQQGGFGARLQVAVKADLSGLNVKTLYFYSYDRASNSYTRIQSPAYWVDLSGYLHFYTSLGGDVIITDKPLALKNAGAK